ncbi:MAG: Adenine deaminase [Saprospiraceae bacterium]|jgi:cytosine/adenosine deaminase-related metal-dependent hydrolase|nr:Adenine deaminase [Saprospiraceae bacterium]
MKGKKQLIFSALIALTAFSVFRVIAQEGGALVFMHAGVIPMTREVVLQDYSVVVEGGRIIEVAPSSAVAIPRGARIIDARGKFLIPGLSDMHVHLEGDAWNIMFGEETRFSSDEISFEDILFLFLAKGITAIDVLFAFPEHLDLREKIRNHEMLGPRLVLSRMIDGAGRAWPPPLGVWVNDTSQAKAAVLQAHKEGYDRIKVYSFLSKEAYDAIIATAKELGMPVDGHVPFSTSVEHVLSSKQSMIAHVEEIMKFAKDYSPSQVEYFASLVANSNTWVTSSLILNRNLNALLVDSAGQFSKPGTEFLHPMAFGIWKFVYDNIYKHIPASDRRALIDGYDHFQKPFNYQFYKKGGKLLIGTDAVVPSTLPAFSLHEELAEPVDDGLSPFEALKVSTTNTYAFLGELERSGTIEPGKLANLVMLEANPLDNISHTQKIAGVMTQNR